MSDVPRGEGQSLRFILLYALAVAGGAVAYVPFLTILLPLRVTDLGGLRDVQWLAYATFAGGIAASFGNILFGWLSDVTRNRTIWVVIGLVLSCVLLQCFIYVRDVTQLVALIIAWQLALNMMLGPLGAWAGDCVPDRQKGLLGGLLALSPALGALSGALVTIGGLANADERLHLVAFLVIVCVAPVLLFGRPRQFVELNTPQEDGPTTDAERAKQRPALYRMWLARLLVQLSESALFAYLYYWFRSIDPVMGDKETSRIFGFVLAAAVPVALLVGRWADIRNRPILPLAVCAGISAVSLLWMAVSENLFEAIAGYVVFGLVTTVFLSLHSAQTLRVLPRNDRRGRDLGIFNLTNTGPSLIMPWLTLALVPVFGFGALFLLLALLALLACVLLATLPRLR